MQVAAELFADVFEANPTLVPGVPEQLSVARTAKAVPAASPSGGPDAWDQQATTLIQRFLDTDDLACGARKRDAAS